MLLFKKNILDWFFIKSCNVLVRIWSSVTEKALLKNKMWTFINSNFIQADIKLYQRYTTLVRQKITFLFFNKGFDLIFMTFHVLLYHSIS